MLEGANGQRFRLPLNQTDIAEACGLTNVHVSRVLSSLRTRGLLDYSEGIADIPDPAALAARAGFSPDYLYVGDATLIP
jgi:CRP-like cAMP-binding protein